MASRPSTTRNINRRVETAIPMARFSICEDDEEAPPTVKRPRFSQPASQSQRSFQRPQPQPQSQSRVLAEEDFEPIPVEDVESDSEGYEEEEDDEDDEAEDEEEEDEEEEDEDVGEDIGSEDDGADHEEAEPVLEGQNQQQQTSANVRSSTIASTLFNNSCGPLQVVLADPEVLDCPICLDPLSSPVFQCENGHIACSSCCSKVNRKCPCCCMPIGYNRCRAIEKVLESIMVACKYARYGCGKLMNYSDKSEHEQMCPHSICFCPHPSCHYFNSSRELYVHFGMHHAASATRFTYNTSFYVFLNTDQRYLFLQEKHESVIFILNQQVKQHGRAFTVDCVGPNTLETSFVYQLTAQDVDGTLSWQCVPGICARWTENTPLSKKHLLVPSELLGDRVNLSLQVRIRKVMSSI